jgi:hypothetical protein
VALKMLRKVEWAETKRCAGAADDCRQREAKLKRPSPDRLMRDVKAALGQAFLGIPIAEREAQLEPRHVPNHLGRKLVPAAGNGLHPLPRRSTHQPFL